MLELSPNEHQGFKLGYGGDTLNTAVYLARLGSDVGFYSAMGDDTYSNELVQRWHEEGVSTELVERTPSLNPGLYIIENDSKGERQFHYWREASAAKQYFSTLGQTDLMPLFDYQYLYLSGISLSLFSEKTLALLWAFLAEYRAQGGVVVFDINYRPRNWDSAERAKEVIHRMCSNVDIALPSFEDECILFGDDSVNHCIERYRQSGVAEIVVKYGGKGCVLQTGEEQCEIPLTAKVVKPVDTTAAGDSFNGGFLAARLSGLSAFDAVLVGQACAAQVIQYPGAIIPRSNFNADLLPSVGGRGQHN